MTVHQIVTFADPVSIAWALAAGLALGLTYFGTLWRNAQWFAEGRPFHAIVTQVARLAVVVVILVLIARSGAVPLLAATVGLLVARRIVLARARRLS